MYGINALGRIKRRRKKKEFSGHLGISSSGISKRKYDGSVFYLKYIEESVGERQDVLWVHLDSWVKQFCM